MTDLVVFGEDWGGHPSSTQHLIRALLPRWRTLWVNSIGLRRPRLTRHDFVRAWNKLTAPRLVSESTGLNPQVVSPKVVPWPGSTLASWVNQQLFREQLDDRVTEGSNPILWLSLPTAVDAIGSARERAVVYYCGDDFGALAGVDHSAVLAAEARLAKVADIIFVASEALAERFPARKTIVIPHGVDEALFATPTARATDLPEGKPIAGFYGNLADWIDTDALCQAAKQLPDWNFVFVGPVQTDVSKLAAQPNVHLLGPRPHSWLPRYSQHWQVSLLPFKDNQQIRACNPLKLREYLAAGSPIVTTDFPALNGYRDCVTLTAADDLASAIISARAKDSGVKRTARQQRVAAESWLHRAEQVEHYLRGL